MSDTFIYNIPFEGNAKLSVEKWPIIKAVENRIGRKLTDAEGEKVWKEIKQGDDWKAVFPSKPIFEKINFAEILKEDIENASNKIIQDVWEDVLDDALSSDLAKIANLYFTEEEITLANVERQTQKRIQDENVRNGLARCANETKKKSIEKWKKNYFLMQHNLDIQNVNLPDGKSEEDFMKYLEGFLN